MNRRFLVFVAWLLVASFVPQAQAAPIEYRDFQDWETYGALDNPAPDWEFLGGSTNTAQKLTQSNGALGTSYFQESLTDAADDEDTSRWFSVPEGPLGCAGLEALSAEMEFKVDDYPEKNLLIAFGDTDKVTGYDGGSGFTQQQTPYGARFGFAVGPSGDLYPMIQSDKKSGTFSSGQDPEFGASTGTIATGVWQTLRVQVTDCTQSQVGLATVTVQLINLENEGVATLTTSVRTCRTNSDQVYSSCFTSTFEQGYAINYLGIFGEGTAGVDSHRVMIDDLKLYDVEKFPVAGALAENPEATCPDPGASDFGFNYVEGVEFGGYPASMDLDDAFIFQGGDGIGHGSENVAIAAKIPEVAGRVVEVRATLEAATEGKSSQFDVIFLTKDPTTYLTGSSLSAGSMGDGQVGGLLDEAHGVRFEEIGNDWRITMIVNSGTGWVQDGSSWLGGTPNAFTSFGIQADFRDGEGELSVFNNAFNDIIVNFPTAYSNRDITGVVFREKGDVALGAATFLNDNDGSWASSCIFQLDIEDTPDGWVGPEGANPGTDEEQAPVDDPDAVGGGGLGGGLDGDPVCPGCDLDAVSASLGFTTEVFAFILAIGLSVGLSLGGAKLMGATGAIGGAVGGIGVSAALAWVPFWFIAFLVLMALGAVVYFRRGG